jgi:hypothetical protein
MDRAKIFGIGLSKTATTSLNGALETLGICSTHGVMDLLEWQGSPLISILCVVANRIAATFHRELLFIRPLLYSFGENSFNFDDLAEYESVSDLPIGLYYPEIDKLYPGSKFILTLRDEDEWIASARHHFDGKKANQTIHTWNKMRLQVYGCIIFDEDKFRATYRNHVQSVREYFKDRPDDLLEVNLCKESDWKPICEFLGFEIPAKSFPHKNKTASDEVKI